MPLRIAAKRFNNELRPAQDLGYLIGCIGEKITVEVDFYFENVAGSIDGSKIVFKPTFAFVGTLDNEGLIYIDNSDYFSTCKVGDTILIPPYSNEVPAAGSNAGTYIISEILSPSTARFVTTLGVPVVFVEETIGINNGYIANISPLKGVKYYWNMVEAGVSFQSLVDGEKQFGATNDALATVLTDIDMPLYGIKSYQIGSIKIKGGGIPNAQQKFTITHETVIYPFFLLNQYDDLLGRIKPSYFEAGSCLNYIAKIEIGKTLKDENSLIPIDVDNPKSNTGWFNENFNGGDNKYTFSLAMTRVSDGESISALEFGEDIEVVATISNPVASFFDVISKCVFGFNYLPESESLYKNNGFDQARNFLLDSKLGAEGVTANGDHLGGAMQVIKTVRLERISATQATVTAVINFGADAEAIMRQGDFMRYMFWVIVENPNIDPNDSDKVNLLLQVGEVHEQLTTIDLIDETTVFLEHPYTDKSDGQDTLEMFPVDDVVARSDFSIDYTGLEATGISIRTIRPTIKLRKDGEADILLESRTINTANATVIGSLPPVQNIDVAQDLVYKREAGIRKTVYAKRDFTLDAGYTKNWYLSYPFMNRWEYWLLLPNLGTIPDDLFDSTLPNNGLNNLWDRLASISGWSLFYELEFEIEQNGILFSQVFAHPLSSQYFLANTEWTNCSIKSYDPDTLTEIVNGGDKFLLGYKDTQIVATFEKTSGVVPDVSQVAIAIWIEPFEGLGEADIRMISSEYDVIAASWFKNPLNRVTLSQAGSVFTGTCIVDYAKLPTNKKFTIYARIYEKLGIVATFYRITNELEIRELMDGDLRIYL